MGQQTFGGESQTRASRIAAGLGRAAVSANRIRGHWAFSAVCKAAMSTNVAIIDYGSGNLHSAAKAFERAAPEEGLTHSIVVTPDAHQVSPPPRLVLPALAPFPTPLP